MAILQVEVDRAKIEAALSAILPFATAEPKLYDQLALPTAVPEADDLDALAHKIADAIRPTGNQAMRSEALRATLIGHDTFHDQAATPDPALRNAVVALSRALRPFSIFDSPLDLICSRHKDYFADGPCKGRYRGIRYVPTELGQRVRTVLKSSGAL